MPDMTQMTAQNTTNTSIPQQQTKLGLSDYLNFLTTLAQLAAALRKPPREKRPIYYGQVGTTGGPMRYQSQDIASFLLR